MSRGAAPYRAWWESELLRRVIERSGRFARTTPRDDVHVDAGGCRECGDLPDDGSSALQLLPAAPCARAHDDLGDLMGASEFEERLRRIFSLDFGPVRP